MQRAAVLIGVRKTGNLRELQAVTSGVRAMERWALGQKIDPALIKVLTDEAGRVNVQQIKDAIDQLVGLATVEQLIVYFAGHGVNLRYGEYWLLSRAPEDTQAAVNVEGSVVLARQCGIPHVVLISDACRTAAEGIQAQFVTGSEIFPNTGAGGPEQCVDLFFACTLGKPALEIKDPEVTAAGFKALYTEALVEALEGKYEQILERQQENDQTLGLLRPWPLKRYLSAEVPRRLTRALVPPGTMQTPDARINSDPESAWLSRLPLLSARRGRRRGASPELDLTPPDTLLAISREVLHGALAGQRAVSPPPVASASLPLASGAKLLTDSLARTATPFGPMHFETGCGFKVRGLTVTEAFHRHVHIELLGAAGDIIRVDPGTEPAVNVLLSFDNGTGTVLPAIPDFITALTFEDGELVNVSYEPSDQSWRWQAFQSKEQELRSLRAVIASSARLGVFRLERDDAAALARRMQVEKGVDPTMAVYAAYAYHDLQNRDRLAGMQAYMKDDLHLRLFDVALLARGLDGRQVGSLADVFPFVPMLSQGWALLRAYRVSLPPKLAGLERHLVPSLWTLFDQAGVAMVRAAMATKEVR